MNTMNIELKDENELYILREALATINAETNSQIHALCRIAATNCTNEVFNSYETLKMKREYIDDLIQKTQKYIEELNPEIYNNQEESL